MGSDQGLAPPPRLRNLPAKKRKPMAKPKQGDRYIPYRRFVGPMIPALILRRKDLKPTEKLTFGRLAQYAGEDGRCFVSYQVLADELGISKRSAIRAVQALEAKGYLELEARTKEGKEEADTNLFYFIWNAVMDGGSDKDYLGGDKLSPPVVTESHHPSDKMSPPVVTDCHPKRTTLREPRNENYQENEEEGSAPKPKRTRESDQEKVKSYFTERYV